MIKETTPIESTIEPEEEEVAFSDFLDALAALGQRVTRLEEDTHSKHEIEFAAVQKIAAMAAEIAVKQINQTIRRRLGPPPLHPQQNPEDKE